MTTETMKTAAGEPNPLVVVPLAALLEMARAHDKVCAALVEMKADRDQARQDWSIASEQVTRADAKRAEVERERDEARAALDAKDRERVQALTTLGGRLIELERERDKAEAEAKQQFAVLRAEDLAKLAAVERERDEARAKLAEAERLFASLRAEDAAKVRELTGLRDRLREALERERISKSNLMGIATRLSDALELDHVPVAAGEDLRELRAWLARARGHEIVAAERPG